jgi:glycine hydroxymethyltransferase
MGDLIFRGSLKELDPDVHELIELESERQSRKIIMIPSESLSPLAVRESLGSAFQNLYAEGYPDEETRLMGEKEILNFTKQLTNYRRYADPRYYKGVEYADIVESLARRRCAETFATEKYSANQIYVNVQPLSGAPANNAVYTALINPGDTILGMNLLHGGHLTHGSSVNRSGKLYKNVHYNVDPDTEQINYDAVQKLATENQPKIIIAGYSSYPWVPDWARFRQIADSIGAILLADVSHIAGLIAAKVVPSPVGFAHVITFTTHKTLCGPRGAVILTTDASLSKKIDKAVFPGEQGGPHVQVMAALATTFKLAQSKQFIALQKQILVNCKALADQLVKRGLRLSYGGTNTHLLNVDCKTVVGFDGTPLSGDMAARILDIAGIVLNRNTIPGDKTALLASGIRMGTPWITQRGLVEKDMVIIANLIADIFASISPYSVETRQGVASRAKIDFAVLEGIKLKIRDLIQKAGCDIQPTDHGYPHYFWLDDKSKLGGETASLEISGEHVRQFMDYTFESDIENLQIGNSQNTTLHIDDEVISGDLFYKAIDQYIFTIPKKYFGLTATWLRELSDGYVKFDDDVTRRLPGPIYIKEIEPLTLGKEDPKTAKFNKAYCIGIQSDTQKKLPEFEWHEEETTTLRHTSLFDTHVNLGAKMVGFAGWEMPVWYTSVVEEHLATRQAAGLFDVSHMGVYQAEGPDAVLFLDSVCGNDIGGLAIGESCYTQFLDAQANVIDDCLVYRRGAEKYLIVVNASNDDKDWAWLNATREGKVLVDLERTASQVFGRNVILRNLRDPKSRKDMRIDIALQGPKSRDILLALGCDAKTKRQVMALKRTELCDAAIGGFDLIVSRTGYTGEKMAFELFVHPEKAVEFWNALLEAGKTFGIKPCGLGARDSLRTEAGLPLYGHEMAGDMGLGVAEAGFGSYVKIYKPWFIGRSSFIEHEKTRKGIVVRFRFNKKGVRMAHHGDPIVDLKGRVIGKVTSCAVDMEGFLTGQAFIEEKYAIENTPIAIYQSAADKPGKAPSELLTGDRVILPTPGTVLSRFPKLN